MKWMTQEEVPDAFGPKCSDGDLTQTNWAVTRYVPWTSWAVGVDDLAERVGQHVGRGRELRAWRPTPTSCRTTSSIPDNYGNPYAPIQQRGFTGMWDMMSRGSFNGPGGPHTRFN